MKCLVRMPAPAPMSTTRDCSDPVLPTTQAVQKGPRSVIQATASMIGRITRGDQEKPDSPISFIIQYGAKCVQLVLKCPISYSKGYEKSRHRFVELLGSLHHRDVSDPNQPVRNTGAFHSPEQYRFVGSLVYPPLVASVAKSSSVCLCQLPHPQTSFRPVRKYGMRVVCLSLKDAR
jgi:hypothetical protein